MAGLVPRFMAKGLTWCMVLVAMACMTVWGDPGLDTFLAAVPGEAGSACLLLSACCRNLAPRSQAHPDPHHPTLPINKQFIAGTLSEPLPPAPPLHVEQQLRDAQYALAAADCAQLALMLANERLRTLCYADTLAALRKEQAAVAARALEAPGQQGQAAAGEAGEAVSIAAAVERVRLRLGLSTYRGWGCLQKLQWSVWVKSHAAPSQLACTSAANNFIFQEP